MKSREKGVEIKVGLFVLAGLAVLLGMIIHFGRLGEGFQKYYELRVEFPNASGLLKGSNVLYSGALIGRVSDHPRITNSPEVLDAVSGVVVTLKIIEGTQLPLESKFIVGSSGLLGDRFVDVVRPAKFTTDESIPPGALLAGTRVAGIEDITREGTELIKDLRTTVNNIDAAVKRANKELLKDSNMKAFETTLQNLKKVTGDFTETGAKLDKVVESAQSAMKSAEDAMKSGEAAMKSGEAAMMDVRGVIKNTNETVTTAREFLEKGMKGEGVLGRMISDPVLGENLEALLSNLRRHGVLFYKDTAGTQSASAATSRPSSPSPSTRSSGRPGR